MPWTTIKDLSPIGDSNSNNLVEPAQGTKEQFGALYYFEDIQVVLSQVDEHFDDLVEINVLFEWPDSNIDQSSGLPVHEITVLAAKRNDGTLYDRVATAWPPYYKRNEDAQVRFPGDPGLEPGQPLTIF